MLQEHSQSTSVAQSPTSKLNDEESSSSSSSSSSRLPYFHEQIDGRCAPFCGTRKRQLWTTLIGAYLLAVLFVIAINGFGVVIALFILTPIFVTYPVIRVVPVFFTEKTSDRTKGIAYFLATAMVVIMAALFLELFARQSDAPSRGVERGVAFGASLLFFLVSAWFVEFVFFFVIWIARWQKLLTPTVERNIAFTRVGLTFLVYTIMFALGSPSGHREPFVQRFSIPVDNLAACADGYKIGMISDVHASVLVQRSEVERFKDMLNAEDVDFTALVGDFSDGRVDEVSDTLTPFRDLTPGDASGFVTGNHEYSHGTPEDSGNSREGALAWMRHFDEVLGVANLNNAHLSVPIPGSATAERLGCSNVIDIAGVEDWTGEPDIDQALANRENENNTVVLLAHQPLHIDQAVENGVALQLSGHTHGGQMWPMHLGAYIGQPYFSGLGLHKEVSHIFVSEGAVGWGPRMRLFAQNEIAVITLRRADTFEAEQRAEYEEYLNSDPLSVQMSVFLIVLWVFSGVACIVNCTYRYMSRKRSSSSDLPLSNAAHGE